MRDFDHAGVFSVTIGAGRSRPQGRLLAIGDLSATALAEALRDLPAYDDGWWSPHIWRGDYRTEKNWRGTWALPADIDYHDERGKHVVPPEAVQARFEAAASSLPGSLFHPTPRGGRLVATLDHFLQDQAQFEEAAHALGGALDRALREVGLSATKRTVRNDQGKTTEAWCSGYKVDDAILADRGRLFFLPNARVDGVARNGELQLLSETPHSLVTVLAWAKEPKDQNSKGSAPGERPFRAISKAAAAWNEDHPQNWPTAGGSCPACGHRKCFGTHPENPLRWVCFSASHANDSGGCGRPGKGCWSGDALDLAARAGGRTRVELLKQEGYLHAESGRRGDRERSTTEPLHAWALSAGTFRLLGWPEPRPAAPPRRGVAGPPATWDDVWHLPDDRRARRRGGLRDARRGALRRGRGGEGRTVITAKLASPI